MYNNNNRKCPVLLFLPLLLVACGGGNSDTTLDGEDSSPSENGTNILPDIGAAIPNVLIVDENAATRYCSADGDVEDEHAGFTGSGFVNTENRIGATIAWNVEAPESLTTEVTIRYASRSDSPRSGKLIANGVEGSSTVFEFYNSGAWDNWVEETHSITLAPGVNYIELIAMSELGLPNIDFFQLHNQEIVSTQCFAAALGPVEPDTTPTEPQEGNQSPLPEENSSPENGITLDDTDLIGWASVSYCGPYGTTGGGSGSPSVTVTSADALIDALTSDGPKVIAVEGTITGVGAVKDISDKTLIGQNGATISGGMRFSRARNIIVANIDFANGSNDTFELSASECIWFDHNNFRDGRDGNLDIVRGSNYVTVSWSRFFYTESHDHMLSNLNGNTNDYPDDEGKIKVTFHHNWWGAGVQERMPRVRYGETHVFNNYYKYEHVSGDRGQNYVIGAGQHSKILVENNYFDGSRNPIAYISEGGTAEVVHSGNAFVDTSGKIVERGDAFIPPYQYSLDPAEDVRALVTSGAGPK